MGNFNCITFVCLSMASLVIPSHTLELLPTNTSLPAPGFGLRTAFDGSDLNSVYVFGAQPSLTDQHALQYSISGDQIQRLQEAGFMYGGIALDDEGFLYYFGGQTMFGGIRSEVWRMRASQPMDRTVVAHFPRSIWNVAAVWDQAEYIYVFGGSYIGLDNENYAMYRFSRVSHTLEVVAELPHAIRAPSGVLDDKSQKIYIFGGNSQQTYSSDIIEFDPAQNTAVVYHVSLQTPVNYSCAVWTGYERGRGAYIIGGASGANGIQRFDPEMNTVEEIYVRNFPTGFWGPSCVFTPVLNRIYIFGGEMRAGEWMRQIMYIPLDPEDGGPDPGLTPVDCKGVLDGTNFPDPSCCKSFYQCYDERAFLYHCPEGLLYSQAAGICVSEELARCAIKYERASRTS